MPLSRHIRADPVGGGAVNYSQHPMGGYVPNMPLNARDPYRELSKRPASQPLSEKDVLRMLPNQKCTRCGRPASMANHD